MSYGLVSHGGQGAARLGPVWSVEAVKAGLGGVRNGMVGRGEVRRSRYGGAWTGMVRFG